MIFGAGLFRRGREPSAAVSAWLCGSFGARDPFGMPGVIVEKY
jgi:hypothetical protein